jgi:hypothetical protein
MLMYLTSWQERAGELRRFWKSYDFDILDEFVERDLVSSSHRAKSAYLTEDGERSAKELLKRYGISDEE